MPAFSEIDAVQWPDNRLAFEYAATIARRPYELAHGPDSRSMAASYISPTITVEALMDDSMNGGRPISAATFTIDIPYWASGAVTHTLSAVDGSFDAPIELVRVSSDNLSLSPGRHLVFIRGQDDEGHWGPVSATFLLINQRIDFFLPVVAMP
jgi:hypothetical protein